MYFVGPFAVSRPAAIGRYSPILLIAAESGTFEAFFDALATMSETAHLVQMFDSTVVRAHVSAAGAKGGSTIRRSAARVAVSYQDPLED
jgi:hypothetical protein